MKFGISMFPADYAIHPSELAREVEARGFESLWMPEHTHIPVSRKTPMPGGSELPEYYWHTHDLFVALTAAAMATTRLRVASGICLIIERDPITTAKEIASLDSLSGGRFIFGIGGGWNAEEMANHGTDFKKRWKILRERILAMKEIWTKDEAEFHGEFVNFDRIWSYPKPAQKPHPPILMGGYGPRTFDRVAEFCDGWLPIGIDPKLMPDKIKELRGKAKDAGRDPAEISVTYIIYGDPKPEAAEALGKAGVERVVLAVPPGPKDSVLPVLDKYV
ncbi:MAG TPA: LLM class F420-dependent oxidoreductase, partial [Thermodesulfobacteriota bacterium]|nr:LLM class F420-dependent oxidoreductase [Thermodesulfobacteriota bacterium]